MKKFKWLQLFAEGGEGGGEGSAGAEGTGAEMGGASEMDAELARIPKRAQGAYKKALERSKANRVQSPENGPSESSEGTEKPQHIPYSDLIKSDDYKEEHKAYMW